MDGVPYQRGCLVRVRSGVAFPAFHSGEEGFVEEHNVDSRNYVVALGSPARNVVIAQRHLEPRSGDCNSVSPSLTSQHQLGEDTCRFCFGAGTESLRCPCACRGSGRWVHESCLRHWQRSILLSGNGRPDESAGEDRHRRCSVCLQEFAAGFEPIPRSEVLRSLAGVKEADLKPGALLRYAKAYPTPEFEEGYQCLIHIFEAQKEHFRNSVYLLTGCVADTASHGDAQVIGINLTRTAQSRWSSSEPLEALSHGALHDEDINDLRVAGVDVSIGIGGPVKPRALGPALLISSSECGGYCVGDASVLRSRALHLANQGERPVELRLFLGHATWSMQQLIGEVTRQSWALVPDGAVATDLAAGSKKLWRRLEDDGRLSWAPSNLLADEYQARARQ